MVEAATPESLMAAYMAGDQGAFQQLFQSLAPRVHAFFLRSFRDRTVADELLQTTFLRVHAGRATYRSGLSVRSWVLAISANVRRDEWRRRYRLREDCDEDALEAAELAQASAQTAALAAQGAEDERVERVRRALDGLPEAQRVVVALHRYEGMSFAQIGETLGMTAGAVRVRAFRAYERLRQELADLGELKKVEA